MEIQFAKAYTDKSGAAGPVLIAGFQRRYRQGVQLGGAYTDKSGAAGMIPSWTSLV